MLLMMVFQVLLWWYLDHVISSNRGSAQSVLFVFQKSYWLSVVPKQCIRNRPRSRKQKKSRRRLTQQDLGIGVSDSQMLESVQIERSKAISNNEKGVYVDGIRIIDLQKVYSKYPFGMKSKKDVFAVKGVTMEIPQNELLCLLGHNGAGKSTMFNMLTGIISYSAGNVKICNIDIAENIERARKYIGVVP